MLRHRWLLVIGATGLALSCGPLQGGQKAQAGEEQPLAIFDLKIEKARAVPDRESLSVRLENLTDKPIWAYILRVTDDSTGESWHKVIMIHGRPARRPGEVWLTRFMAPEDKGIDLARKRDFLRLNTDMVVFSDGSIWGGDSHPRKHWELTQLLVGRTHERMALQALYKRQGVEALVEALMADAPAEVQALKPVKEEK